MALTLQDPASVQTREFSKENPRKGNAVSYGCSEASAVATRSVPTATDALFGAEPVDLTAVCEEIKRNPGLQVAAIRLLHSLSLSAEESANTLEEAAIALGTGRLKALFKGWAMLQAKEFPSAMLSQPVADDSSSDLSLDTEPVTAPWTPESLYLAGFLRILGLDMPDARGGKNVPQDLAARIPIVPCPGLTDIFIRDFLALLPSLGDSFVAPHAKAFAACVANQS